PTDVPGAYRVARVDDQALADGRIWPQSRASQVAALAVGAREGERVLDCCAAPGGKAAMLRGHVTAVDLNEARARELEENLRTLGAGDVTVVQADATMLPPELDPDATLADEWPQFRHPTQPEFLLTLPHVHHTSGFFIARLRVT